MGIGPGTKFKRVIDDDATQIVAPEAVKRVVFCTGKLFYELAQERKNKGIKDVAFVRVEQVRTCWAVARGAVGLRCRHACVGPR